MPRLPAAAVPGTSADPHKCAAHPRCSPPVCLPCQSKRRPHLALEGGEQQQQQQQGAAAIGDLEDFGANPAAAAAAAAGPVAIATSVDPESAAAAAGREGENAAAAANQADEEMPDRWGSWGSLLQIELFGWGEHDGWLSVAAVLVFVRACGKGWHRGDVQLGLA